LADAGRTDHREDAARVEDVFRIRPDLLAEQAERLAPALLEVIAWQDRIDERGSLRTIDAGGFEASDQRVAIRLVPALFAPAQLREFAFEHHAQAADFFLDRVDYRRQLARLPVRSRRRRGLQLLRFCGRHAFADGGDRGLAVRALRRRSEERRV